MEEKKQEGIESSLSDTNKSIGLDTLSQTQEAAAKIRALHEPARGFIAPELQVGTILSDKPSTKALEKIIKRQEKRIEELATKLGTLQCITDTDDDNWNRLLAATNSKGASEALAKVEALFAYCKAKGLHLAVVLDDIKCPDITKRDEPHSEAKPVE